MGKYKVYINVYHVIEDIEADSPEEAKELATTEYIWDAHIIDCDFEVEENSND